MSMSPVVADSSTTQVVNALFADLQQKDYEHYTGTPETHKLSFNKRVKLAEPERLLATTVNDLWGWSIPGRNLQQFHSQKLIDQLLSVGFLVPDESDPTVFIPKIRVSCLYSDGRPGNYYIHSSWPTSDVSSVFFGPDSYRMMRYMNLIGRNIPNPSYAIDMCTGAGVGAIHLARMYPRATVYGLDINQHALTYANINAMHQQPNREVRMIVSNGFKSVVDELRGKVDIISMNPPYIAGDERTYAGGGPTGMDLTMRLIDEAWEVLRVGGEIWFHMASPISFDGKDGFKEACKKLPNFVIADYDVIDVDIFGDEMENHQTYKNIGRLACVGVVLRKIIPATDNATPRARPRAPIA